MNFAESIEKIKTELKRIGKESIAQEILKLQLAGGTGGEVLISVCSKLLDLKRNNKQVYESIRDEVEKLIDYSRSLGLFPE